MKKLSLTTQFKIEFLLPFASCRKVIGKMPDGGEWPKKRGLGQFADLREAW